MPDSLLGGAHDSHKVDRRVRHFVASALAPQPAQANCTPTLRAAAAVAAAMQLQLHELDGSLLALQEDWLSRRHPHTGGRQLLAPPLSMPGVTAAELTLVRLDAETRGVADRLLLLGAVTEAVAAPAAASHAAAGAGTEAPAAAAARVVDGLQALLAPRLLRGGPQSGSSVWLCPKNICRVLLLEHACQHVIQYRVSLLCKCMPSRRERGNFTGLRIARQAAARRPC